MFSVINGGQAASTPKPEFEVRDLIAMLGTTNFTTEDRRCHGTDTSRWTAFRVRSNHDSVLAVRACGQESSVTIPDGALDTVIRALEELRAERDRCIRPIGLAEPLVEDESSGDDAGPSMARGHGKVETMRGTSAGNAIADALDAHRALHNGDGPVAA